MNHCCDIAILGGGCAGLSLAAELAIRAPRLRVHILEARTEYVRDRSWCFWNTEPHAFERLVEHSWPQWTVRATKALAGESDAVVCRGQRYRYQHLPSDRFYRAALHSVETAPAQTLSLGVTVDTVTSLPDGLRLETTAGSLTAAHVFDSRPPRGPWTDYHGAPVAQDGTSGHAPGFVQRFVGWHVRADKPCFDPQTVQLMDFCPVTEPGRVAFFYVLPFSRDEALVEYTCIDRPGMPPADAEARLRERLEASCGAYEVLYREQGALPMAVHAAEAGAQMRARGTRTAPVNIVAIGGRGLRLRACSGYAFLRIQRQSRALAAALATGAALPRQYEPDRFAALDRIFLHAMQQAPGAVPDYFARMFAKAPADALVRFLSETASPRETLQVAATLPKLPLARAAWSTLLARSA